MLLFVQLVEVLRSLAHFSCLEVAKMVIPQTSQEVIGPIF